MIGYVKNHYNLHVVGRFGKTTQIPVEKVISWQTEALTTSIRHLPDELIPIAKQAFRNISGLDSRTTDSLPMRLSEKERSTGSFPLERI